MHSVRQSLGKFPELELLLEQYQGDSGSVRPLLDTHLPSVRFEVFEQLGAEPLNLTLIGAQHEDCSVMLDAQLHANDRVGIC
jgi:hypothetical protein